MSLLGWYVRFTGDLRLVRSHSPEAHKRCAESEAHEASGCLAFWAAGLIRRSPVEVNARSARQALMLSLSKHEGMASSFDRLSTERFNLTNGP